MLLSWRRGQRRAHLAAGAGPERRLVAVQRVPRLRRVARLPMRAATTWARARLSAPQTAASALSGTHPVTRAAGHGASAVHRTGRPIHSGSARRRCLRLARGRDKHDAKCHAHAMQHGVHPAALTARPRHPPTVGATQCNARGRSGLPHRPPQLPQPRRAVQRRGPAPCSCGRQAAARGPTPGAAMMPAPRRARTDTDGARVWLTGTSFAPARCTWMQEQGASYARYSIIHAVGMPAVRRIPHGLRV